MTVISRGSDAPILFSEPMVRAILDGRKGQTRRVLKAVPDAPSPDNVKHPPKHPAPYLDSYCSERKTASNPRGMSQNWCWWTRDDRPGSQFKVRYVPGMLLWVRENWTFINMNREGERHYGCVGYDADGPDLPSRPFIPITKEAYEALWDRKRDIWLHRRNPSIHMPRWASRLTLEVTAVKVERLQDISREDAIAEGVVDTGRRDGAPYSHCIVPGMPEIGVEHDAVSVFGALWEHINGPGSWEANPWIVAVSFKAHRQNIDQFKAAQSAPLNMKGDEGL